MKLFNSLSGRAISVTVFMFLALAVTAGCAEEPAEVLPVATRTPLPTLALKPVETDPTPTLAHNAPTRALPTPLITRSSSEQERTAIAEDTATPSGPTATPTATPEIADRLVIGDESLAVGNFELASEQFSKALRQEPGLDTDEQADTLFKLGRSYLAEERFMDAATIFNQLIALHGAEDIPDETQFLLGQAYMGQDAFELAIEAYTTFLAAEPHMGGYIYPLIAGAYQALGDEDGAQAAYEEAVEAPAYLVKQIQNHLLLADAYLAVGDYAAAIEQYDLVHDMAKTEETRGQVTFQAGAAELLAGNIEAAHARFQKGIETYPEAYETYLGLVELVKAEVPIDDFQRGLVDFNASAYAPGIEALQAHIDNNPDSYNPDAYLYLAWSHEALDDLESALSALEVYTMSEPATGMLEQGKMQARAGDLEAAVALYEQFLESFPDHEDAPYASWWLAAYTAELGDVEAAISYFIDLADNYPDHEDAPEALYRAGTLAAESEDFTMAVDLWTRSAGNYPANLYGSASLLALQRMDDQTAAESLETLLLDGQANTTYQAFRARDLAQGNPAFASTTEFILPGDETDEGETAEEWLAEQFDLDPDLISSELSAELLQDERLIVGQRLWELGLFEEAKFELESLRQDIAEDPLGTYQLALFLRDLGLYRSSIIAGATLLHLAGTHELDAPRPIGRLVYPVYYADLILLLAEQYGYDPRLQFSLVRQESLFESFARSGAAAQGLSQVIPETGAWIAEELQWPDYENEDLYKPYVGLNFGAYYLSEQLKFFDGHVHAALAAYNAGPGNAARWYETAGSDIDLFVDTIDFNETKAYVERIYAGYNIYSRLYGPQ